MKDEVNPLTDAPDMLYILYRYIIVFNDFNNEMMIIEMLQDGEKSGIERVRTAIRGGKISNYEFHAIGETTSPLTDEEHKANIRKGIAHC